MKTINKLNMSIILIALTVLCKAQSDWNIENWKNQVLSDISSVKMTETNLSNFNFSNILLDNRVSYLGYIGDNYQRLYINFSNIIKVSASEYSVTGYSKVKSNKCEFIGTIKIEELHELKTIDFGVDNWMKGKVNKQGFIVANFYLTENNEQKGSGIFQGILISKWYLDSNNKLLYDDIRDDSDSYSNNQFLGSWTSYKTKISKKCAWGQYRIPCSVDLDIGAAEFSVNPKYMNNGWEDDNDNCNDEKLTTTDNFYHQTFSNKWRGHYTLSIDYGKLDEFSDMSIDYDIVIDKDSCVFLGIGYKTYFTDLCRVKENNNKLYLMYLKTIDGDGFTNHSKIDTIAVIMENREQYYIKSPIVANKNWKYNLELLLQKEK